MVVDCVIGTTVYDSDGTTALSSISIRYRNERTNELYPLTVTTNSEGKAAISCSNFVNGWAVDDKITIFVLYNNYEDYETVTAIDGGITKNLILQAIATSDSLRYFSVQDLYDYTGLLTTDVAPEKVINVGTAMETEIDNLCGQKFDNNDGSYYSVTEEYSDVRNNWQQDYWTKWVPIYSVSKFEVNEQPSNIQPNWINIAYDQLDACDSTTDWSISTDGAITLNQTTGEYFEGTGCLYIAKSGTSSATLTMSKTFGSTYDMTSRTANVKFYFDSAADFNATDSVELRLGNDSSNYYYEKLDISEFGAQSWQNIPLSIDTADGTTGSPDASTIDYIAIIFTTAAASTTLTAGDIRIDDIKMGNIEDLRRDDDTGRVSILTEYTRPYKGVNNVRMSYKYGYATVPGDIKSLAILMTSRRLIDGRIIRANIAGRDSFSPTQLDAIGPAIKMLLARYRKVDIRNV